MLLAIPAADGGRDRFHLLTIPSLLEVYLIMKRLLSFACLMVFSGATRADIIYVNAAAAGAQTGTSWADAFADLQDGLAVAKAGDEIWVAGGKYYPGAAGQRDRSFRIPDGVKLYGGFQGDERSPNQRDWLRCRSRLTGNIGDAQRRKDNTQRIIEAIRVDEGTLIDGFVIQNAFNERDAPLGRGGGAYVENSGMTISNCRIRRNYAGGGGGMWIQSSQPMIVNCSFIKNTGRGISSNDSHPYIQGCQFDRNYTHSDGAGLGLFNGSTATVTSTLFFSNVSDNDGGAYFGLDAATFVDCVFMGNSCRSWGGAIDQFLGPLTMVNCSVYGNSTRWAGGVYAQRECTLINSIFWGNRDQRGNTEAAQIDFYHNQPIISNTLVEGWTGRWGGEGNFDGNPKWVDAKNGNLRLRHNSPCIDAGTDDAVTEPFDLDGNPRILGQRVDIGAYENLCADVTDLSAQRVEATKDGGGGGGGGGARCVGQSDGDGLCEPGEDCCIVATVSVNTATLPAGSTVRVVFTPLDENGKPELDPCCATRECGPEVRCPIVRKARIDALGAGAATLRGCGGGSWRVCVEGCGESFCREVECP